MKSSIKAALFSALIFPGAGQMLLKQYRRGFILLLLTLIPLFFVLRDDLQQAVVIADKIQSGAMPLDAQVISQSVENADTHNALPLDIARYMIAACWFIGIIDAFRAGKRKDATAQIEPQA